MLDFEYPEPGDWLWDPWSNWWILALFLACVLMIASAFLIPLIGDTPVIIMFIAVIGIALYLFLSSKLKHSRRFKNLSMHPCVPDKISRLVKEILKKFFTSILLFLNVTFFVLSAGTPFEARAWEK